MSKPQGEETPVSWGFQRVLAITDVTHCESGMASPLSLYSELSRQGVAHMGHEGKATPYSSERRDRQSHGICIISVGHWAQAPLFTWLSP